MTTSLCWSRIYLISACYSPVNTLRTGTLTLATRARSLRQFLGRPCFATMSLLPPFWIKGIYRRWQEMRNLWRPVYTPEADLWEGYVRTQGLANPGSSRVDLTLGQSQSLPWDGNPKVGPPLLKPGLLASSRCKPRLFGVGDRKVTICHPLGRYPQLTPGSPVFQPHNYD